MKTEKEKNTEVTMSQTQGVSNKIRKTIDYGGVGEGQYWGLNSDLMLARQALSQPFSL
jgi:hypothetical protein